MKHKYFSTGGNGNECFLIKNIRSRSTARETEVFCQSALKEYMSLMKEQIRNKKTAAMETGVLVAMKWMIFMNK